MLALKHRATIAINPYQIRKYLDLGYTICDDHAVALRDPESYIPIDDLEDTKEVVDLSLLTDFSGGNS